MRNFYTSVVELSQTFTSEVFTEPYECGWATEAQFFVTVEEADLNFESLALRVQVSPDGVRWVDEGSVLPPISGSGTKLICVQKFGGWLRLAGKLSGGKERGIITVHLALKE